MTPWIVLALLIVLLIGVLWVHSRQGRGPVDPLTARRMRRLAAAVQPYCDEKIIAAIPCEHAKARSTGSDLLTARARQSPGGTWPGTGLGTIPEQVFLALGSQSIYAFDYSPKVFGFQIKRQVARWPRDQVSVVAEYTSMMIYFIITTSSGEDHAFQASAMSFAAGRPAVGFLEAVGAKDYRQSLNRD